MTMKLSNSSISDSDEEPMPGNDKVNSGEENVSFEWQRWNTTVTITHLHTFGWSIHWLAPWHSSCLGRELFWGSSGCSLWPCYQISEHTYRLLDMISSIIRMLKMTLPHSFHLPLIMLYNEICTYLYNLDVNESLTVNSCEDSISLVFGVLSNTRWAGLPNAKDWRARTRSRSGMSVSFCISWRWRIIVKWGGQAHYRIIANPKQPSHVKWILLFIIPNSHESNNHFLILVTKYYNGAKLIDSFVVYVIGFLLNMGTMLNISAYPYNFHFFQ